METGDSKSKVTDKLINLLSTEDKKNNNSKEEKEMANINEKMERAKREADANSTKDGGVKVEDTNTGVTSTVEGSTPEDTTSDSSVPPVADTLAETLAKAKAEADAAKQLGADPAKTTLFDKESNIDNSDELTPEEAEKEAAKALKKYEREAEIAKYNQDMEARLAELTSKVGNEVELTSAQKAFQMACSKFMVSQGMIVVDSAVPEIGLQRNWKAEKKVPIYRAGVSQAEIDLLKTAETKNRPARANIQEFTTSFKYRYSTAKKFVGGIISIPQCLNLITIEKFNSGIIEVPDAKTISSDLMLHLPVDHDTFYSYIVLFCGGHIKEAGYMKQGKFAGANVGGEISARVVLSSQTVGGVKQGLNKRAFSVSNRSSLLVHENIIPIRKYETENIKSLTPDTLAAYNDQFKKKLGVNNKAEKYTNYENLDETSKKLFKATLNGTEVTDVILNFANGGNATLGAGAFEAYMLQHWSNSTMDANRKVKGTIVKENPVAKYQKNINKNDPTKVSFKKVYSELGKDITLVELATQFPAAAKAVELGITTEDILGLYNKYTERVKADREQKAALAGRGQAARKRENVVNADLATQMLVNELLGKGNDMGLNMDTNTVRSSILSNSYNYVTPATVEVK